MAHLSKLEFAEPLSLCEIRVGTFYWKDTQGESFDADFYVKTCQDDKSKQADDYNEQYTDEFYRLIQLGYTDISFVEVTPNPIF